MRILFHSDLPLTKQLGAPKVLLELAEAVNDLGCESTILDAGMLRDNEGGAAVEGRPAQRAALRSYLQMNGEKYDVIDYHHLFLPFPRSEFDPRSLFVARSVLLSHHLQKIPIPAPRTLKGMIGRAFHARRRRMELDDLVAQGTNTLVQADLVNVSNEDDKEELLRRGIPSSKIVVIPFGISLGRRAIFEAISSKSPAPLNCPIVAFVGSFDPRKGSLEFPTLVRHITRELPNARFRLLGTQGLHPTAQSVFSCFPHSLRPHLEIYPTFKPDELPSLLKPCSLGIFPSYLEGFPFGVLEMLAASLPVVAYDAPGPPMMLSDEFLVPRGNASAMAEKVVSLLRDSRALERARTLAKSRAAEFTWEKAARMTVDAYQYAIESRSNRHVDARNPS